MENFPTAERQHDAPEVPKQTLFDDDFLNIASARAQKEITDTGELDFSKLEDVSPAESSVEEDIIAWYDRQIEELEKIAEEHADKRGISLNEAMKIVDETNILGRREAALRAQEIENEKRRDAEYATIASVYLSGFREGKLKKEIKKIRDKWPNDPKKVESEIIHLKARARLREERRQQRS